MLQVVDPVPTFFVRHAYFPGSASDPYKSLRITLKAEIDKAAWESLRKLRARPYGSRRAGAWRSR